MAQKTTKNDKAVDVLQESYRRIKAAKKVEKPKRYPVKKDQEDQG